MAKGFKSEYENQESELGRRLKYFFGLPYLPPNEVGDGFTELLSIAPNNITPFTDYIVKNYTEDGCSFLPDLWAGIPSEEPRTTNGPESYHKHLKAVFYQAKPSIHTFIDVLKNFQAEQYIKMQTTNVLKKNRKQQTKTDMAIAAWQDYEKHQDLAKYLKKICFKFQPVII